MKRRKIVILLSVFTLVLVSLSAIPTASVATHSAEEPIKIGLFAPFTSAALSFYAPWTKQGFELGMIYATDETNATNAGRPYEIIEYDTKGSPTDAATLAVQAIETDGIDIMVGATYSSVAAALVPIAEQYEKLFFISPAADAALTGVKFNKYIFRVARNNWHDAKAGIKYAIDTVGATKFAFLAADYSFGYSGVATMTAEIFARGGSVVATEYASLATTDFTPQITSLLAVEASVGIDYLMIVWAGNFAFLYGDLATNEVANYMDVGGAAIDIFSMNVIEASLTPPATIEGGIGLCLYGYELPDNPVNDWMVEQHVLRNIKPNGAFGLEYRVPELFTASGFGTAQFLVDATNAVPDLDVEKMICHLEGLTITTPKGPTYMRPEDHQGLAEMYIAEIWKDDRPDSETYGFLIAKLVERIPPMDVAPPVDTIYTPCPPEPVTITETVVSEMNPKLGLLFILAATFYTLVLMRKRKK